MPVSAIIPTYGRAESLAAAVASALVELGPEDELIVVDDASDPPLILPEALASDVRVRLVRAPKNGGAGASRNLGIREARCEIVAFLDSDDRWRPGKLAAQLPMLERPSPVAVSCGWIETVRGVALRQRVPIASRQRSDFFSGVWHSPGSTLVLRKSEFERIGPFDETLRRLEDYEWFLRFAMKGGRLLVADVSGAEIAQGTNAGYRQVHAAATRIVCLPLLVDATPDERRRLQAYLQLTLAAAARGQGRHAWTAWHLMRSFARVPRLGLQVESWWPS